MRYFAGKFVTLIVTLLIVSFLAFLAFQVIPGDPTTAMLGSEATEEAVQALRQELGLDRPVLVRYWNWLTDFVRGDFGRSYNYQMPVAQMLADKLPITFLLTVLSFGITVVLSIPLGIAAGSAKNRVLDILITAVDQVVMSIPPFFLGILLTFIFGTVLKVFTTGAFVSFESDPAGCLAYLLLPAFSCAIPRIAMTVKMLRSSILNQQEQMYVLTARSRGNAPRAILVRHVLKNALFPVIAFLATSAAEIMTGSIIIEQIFAIPGISRLLLASVSSRDFPVVQAIVVILAAWIVLVNFAADLLYQLVDPRVRMGGSR